MQGKGRKQAKRKNAPSRQQGEKPDMDMQALFEMVMKATEGMSMYDMQQLEKKLAAMKVPLIQRNLS